MRADVEFKPLRPTMRQWIKALIAGLLDADASAHSGQPPVSTYDPHTDARARAVLVDGETVIWNTDWTPDIARAETDRDRIAALLSKLGDDEVRHRANSGTLVPEPS